MLKLDPMHSSSQIQDAKANLASLPTVSIENLQVLWRIWWACVTYTWSKCVLVFSSFDDSITNIKIDKDINGNSENHEAGAIEEHSQIHHNHSSSTDTTVEVVPIQDGNRSSVTIPDCTYFLKHGEPYFSKSNDLPERIGQPDCQHFLRTGTCKYGSTCKYNHPKNRFSGDISFNIDGLPIRKGERFCPYYMRTRYCKFGIDCKFSHPQPYSHGSLFSKSGVSSVYPPIVSSMTSPPGMSLIGGGIPSWPPTRPFWVSPGSWMPMLLPCGQQDWNSYMDTVGPVTPSTGMVMSSPLSNNSTTTTQVIFPERPDQPDCQYYIKNGSCKYGSSCKYHHPRDRITSSAACTIGPLGLPLRPGQAMCTFYNTYGTCKYGLGCKFDHPVMNYYNYTDPSIIFPNYQRNSPVICTPPDSTMSKSLKLTTDEGGDVTTKSKITTTTTIATVDSNDANLLSEETSVAVTPQSSLQSSSSALENLLEANDQSSID